MNSKVQGFYQEKSEKYSAELTSVTQKVRWFAWYRFFAFLFIFFPLFIFGIKSFNTLLISVAAIILFFFLVKKNIQLENQKKKLTVLIKLVKDEIQALKHSFSHFKNGAGFLNTDHFFSYDLDLFGEGSLYQFLNRTATKNGARKLAAWLMNPPLSKNEIEKRRQAIQELSENPEWRLQFLAEGSLFEESDELNDEIITWSEMEISLNNAEKIKWLIRIIPAFTILSAIPSILGIT